MAACCSALSGSLDACKGGYSRACMGYNSGAVLFRAVLAACCSALSGSLDACNVGAQRRLQVGLSCHVLASAVCHVFAMAVCHELAPAECHVFAITVCQVWPVRLVRPSLACFLGNLPSMRAACLAGADYSVLFLASACAR
eukprot:1156958-Pelagomonas_calceolata.AAC.1